FRPAPTESVTLGAVRIEGSAIELRSFTVATWEIDDGAQNVVLEDLVSSTSGAIFGAANVCVERGSIDGSTANEGGLLIAEGKSNPTNITLTGLRVRNTAGDCIHVGSVKGLTARRLRVENCQGGTGFMFAAYGTAPTLSDVTIENTFVAHLG